MRESETTSTCDTIKVTVGRFGSAPVDIEVPVDSTVLHALTVAGLQNESGNRFVNGAEARDDNLLDDGDVINIVTSKEGGSY